MLFFLFFIDGSEGRHDNITQNKDSHILKRNVRMERTLFGSDVSVVEHTSYMVAVSRSSAVRVWKHIYTLAKVCVVA